MAFDVYVGTMTRFYLREWENVAQRMAREQGMHYQMIYAGGEPEPPPSADDLRQAVASWCEALSGALQSHGFGPVVWDEDEQKPYFTDRPAWDGYSALLVWAAHAEHPALPIPAEAPQSWAEDPAYQRSTLREFKSRYRTILEPELWLPTEFPFVFEAATLVSEKACIGSVFTLKQQLDDLHQQTGTQLERLRQTPQVDAPGTKKPGFLGGLFRRTRPRPEPDKPGLAEVAESGLAIFRDLSAKACEHRLPMLLHY
ncbi:MAG TPA: hypothetical protein VL371_14010 [Gemmataceae bacterium]|nr:hypothetical protein [Gemmataceae bacterium]